MSAGNGNQFAAADPAIGYLYQVRSALLWALQRLKNQSDFLVSIETLDDVAFETSGGTPIELLQTKHHRTAVANLTDASPDLWKTIRVWIESDSSGSITSTTSLILVTTGMASDNSAASRLRSTGRDVEAARASLDATAASSTNQTNKAAYDAYLGLSGVKRKALLEQMIVLDAAPTITSLDDRLREEVFWAAGKEHHDAFLDRLEGWWLRRVLKQLASTDDDRIGAVELEAQMADLREQFKQESLPIDDDLLEFILDDATREAHEGSTFVRQLAIIKAGKRRIANSIRDYFRAFEQRSRWLRLDLIVEMELHKYEKRLLEEWEIVFDAMKDELGADATADAKESSARTVLAWAERTSLPIRSNVTEPFVSRGSFHMLSEESKLGWHPDFLDRLAELLDVSGEKA